MPPTHGGVSSFGANKDDGSDVTTSPLGFQSLECRPDERLDDTLGRPMFLAFMGQRVNLAAGVDLGASWAASSYSLAGPDETGG